MTGSGRLGRPSVKVAGVRAVIEARAKAGDDELVLQRRTSARRAGPNPVS
jgi:hypothetical protein